MFINFADSEHRDETDTDIDEDEDIDNSEIFLDKILNDKDDSNMDIRMNLECFEKTEPAKMSNLDNDTPTFESIKEHFQNSLKRSRHISTCLLEKFSRHFFIPKKAVF